MVDFCGVSRAPELNRGEASPRGCEAKYGLFLPILAAAKDLVKPKVDSITEAEESSFRCQMFMFGWREGIRHVQN